MASNLSGIVKPITQRRNRVASERSRPRFNSMIGADAVNVMTYQIHRYPAELVDVVAQMPRIRFEKRSPRSKEGFNPEA